MVNDQASLDATFAALADPTRRGILAQLARGETRVTDLAQPYRMSLPAVSKHLRVLERAGLITRSRRGREHHIRVDPRPIREAADWITMYADAWQHQLDALGTFLEGTYRETVELSQSFAGTIGASTTVRHAAGGSKPPRKED